MNKPNMDKLIAHMERMPEKAFNMDHWITGRLGNRFDLIRGQGIMPPLPVSNLARTVVGKQTGDGDCGTVACIGGEAVILALAEDSPIFEDRSLLYTGAYARVWLGLTKRQADLLFTPANIVGGMRRITLPQAVACLKNLRETGRVAWRKVGAETY